jgi:hypothetical protein
MEVNLELSRVLLGTSIHPFAFNLPGPFMSLVDSGWIDSEMVQLYSNESSPFQLPALAVCLVSLLAHCFPAALNLLFSCCLRCIFIHLSLHEVGF